MDHADHTEDMQEWERACDLLSALQPDVQLLSIGDNGETFYYDLLPLKVT